MSGWIPADWPAPESVIAGSTTRQGGVSTGVFSSLNLGDHVGDNQQRVNENRRRFVASCGLPQAPEWLNQVHGCEVAVVGEHRPSRADAAVATAIGEVVAVMTADCLPVLLCADDGKEVAAVHGGWRGLAGGVLGATLARMRTPPARLMAWLGPAISQVAFEVGDEVREVFVSLDSGTEGCFEANDRGRWQADLYGIAHRQLGVAGVTAVYGGNFCTYTDARRFFSYRRDGQCGRMATFIHRRV